MDKFTVKEIYEKYSGYPNLKRLFNGFSIVLGEDFKESNKFIYPQFLISCANDSFKQDKIKIYFIHNKNFYILSFNEPDFPAYNIEFKPLRTIKNVKLTNDPYNNNISLCILFEDNIEINISSKEDSFFNKLKEQAIFEIFKNL